MGAKRALILGTLFNLSVALHDLFVHSVNGINGMYSRGNSLIESNKAPIFSIACHHKTGSSMLLQICYSARSILGRPIWINKATQKHKIKGNLRVYTCFNQSHFTWLTNEHEQTPFKLVHVIRDPVETVVSGYWYHLNSIDTQNVPNTGPAILQTMNLSEGLEHEAKMELSSTLAEMKSTVSATKGDSRVLTIGFEDFMDNFDSATRRIYNHFLGTNSSEVDDLVAKALVAADMSRRTIIPKKKKHHMNSREQYSRAMYIINASKSTIWDKVRAVRADLDYMQVAPGIWRYKNGMSGRSQLAAHKPRYSRTWQLDDMLVPESLGHTSASIL